MTDTALLKFHLNKLDITQTELAEKLNISFAALNYKINNKRGFSTDEIYNITKILGLSLEEKDQIFFCEKGAD